MELALSGLYALSMNSKDSGVEIEILHPQFHALEESKPAAIQQFDRKGVGMPQFFQDSVYFLSGKNYGYILRFLRTGNVLVIAEIFFQNMPKQKQ